MALPAALVWVLDAVTLAVALFLVVCVGTTRVVGQHLRYHCCLKRAVRARRPPAQARDLAAGRLAMLAPHGHPALGESACTIARKLREGKYSSVDVVTAFLAQARRVNKSLK